jgi:hypothetical protein
MEYNKHYVYFFTGVGKYRLTKVSKLTASVVYWSLFLATDPEVRVRFPELPDFLRSSGSAMGSTQPCEYNRGTTWKKI